MHKTPVSVPKKPCRAKAFVNARMRQIVHPAQRRRFASPGMHVCLILFPGFPMLGYVLIREVLRLANACAGQALFSCEIRTVSGAPVMACDGTEIRAHAQDWDGAQGFDLVVLCAGPDPLDHLPMGLRGFLARADAAEATLAGLDQGALILARLGFLDGREAVLPRDLAPDAAERFPGLALSARSHVFDRARLTSTGGMASAEALLDWIGRMRGPALSAQVAEALALGRLRNRGRDARMATRDDSTDPVMTRMLAIMAAHMEAPLPLPRLAAELELNVKQLRRRCRKALDKTPSRICQELRLKRGATVVARNRRVGG